MTHVSRKFSRVPALAVLIAVLAIVTIAPASAQTAVPRYGEPDKDKTPTEIAADKEARRAYEKSLGNIPEQKSSDPWGIARDPAAPKAVAKTAAPKPKTAAAKTAAAKTDTAKPVDSKTGAVKQ
jgi:hypothetical protein